MLRPNSVGTVSNEGLGTELAQRGESCVLAGGLSLLPRLSLGATREGHRETICMPFRAGQVAGVRDAYWLARKLTCHMCEGVAWAALARVQWSPAGALV